MNGLAHMPRSTAALVLAFFCSWPFEVWAVAYRPGREFRTINTDIYEVSVQKNGRTDVRLVTREPLFDNAYPMVWLEGEEAPQPLTIDGRSTAREGVKTALGEGQGMRFLKDNCDWIVQAYPTKTFLTVQAAFVNNTKKTVRVKALIPWAVGGLKEGGVYLGAGAADCLLLDNGSLAQIQATTRKLSEGPCTSLWNVAAINPGGGRCLVAGFLSNTHGLTQIHVERSPKAKDNAIDILRAECVYDPPIEVPPKGRFESEILYLSIAESDPLQALEHYGAAVAAFNQRKPSRRNLPHGWDSWNAKFKTDINENNMIAALDFVASRLKRYGWTHFSLDAGWELAKGDWEPNPEKFPHGMKWFVDQVHQRGMTAGIWIDPFTVDINSPLAKEHPEWMAMPAGLGKEMMAENERILDITAPGAYDYVKGLIQKVTRGWGYDALVEADFVYHLLLAEKYAQPNLTRVEVLRTGMAAIREGMGDDRFLLSMPPGAITGAFVDGLRIGNDCAPVWRKSPESWAWGCVDTLSNAAHRYFMASNVWVPDQDCAYFGFPETRARWGLTDKTPSLTEEQSLAWLTGAALTGGIVKIGDAFTDLSEKQVQILSRLLPTARTPARPVDLFERDIPCIWSLPINSAIGQWGIVGVFNWDANASQKIPVSFTALGLDANTFYTVYDFWKDTYYGLAKDKLAVDIGPGSVRLLGLRRYEDRPMFLATDRHFTQGATDFKKVEWNPTARTLSGTFDGVENTDYNLRVLVPEQYKVANVTVSTGDPAISQDGLVLKIAFHCAAQGTVTWTVQF